MTRESFKQLHISTGALLLLVLVLATACGSSGTKKAATSATSSTSAVAEATATTTTQAPARSAETEASHRGELASLVVETGARSPDGTVAKRYTCKGADVSPSMTWSAVPPSTKEIVVVVRTLQEGQLTTNWIVAGLDPKLKQISAGRVPAGAIIGRNSFGKNSYELCPSGGKAALVVFAMFALSHPLGVHTGFEPGVIDDKAGSPGVAWGSVSAAITRTAGPAA